MSFENLIDAYESASADSNGDYTFSYATFPLIAGVADYRQIELQWTPSQVTRVSDGALVSINDLSPSDASLAAIVPAGALVFDSFTHTVRLDQSEYVSSSFTGDSNVIYNRTDLVLPTDARPIYVKRATPLDAKLVTYQSGSKIAASTMNLADDQYFNALQEVKAGVDFVAGSLSTVGTIEVSISPNGSVATAGDLPASANQGDLYVVLDTNDAYTYNGTSWDNIGPLRGSDGAQGNDGSAATIAVASTTTGAEGTSASVTNVGTSNAAQLEFVIPKGDTGETGEKGDTGADSIVEGPRGLTGTDRLALLLPDTEYTVGQALDGRPLYAITKTYTSVVNNEPLWDEATDDTNIIDVNILSLVKSGVTFSNNFYNSTGSDLRLSKDPSATFWSLGSSADDVKITWYYTKTQDGVDNAISTTDFNILELDNFISPTNILRLNQEVEIGQATNGKPLYSVTKEILDPSDEGVLYSIDSDAELQYGEVLSYTQSGVLWLNNSNGNDNNETQYSIYQEASHAGNEFKFKTGIINNNTTVTYRLFYTKEGDGVSDAVPVNELANVTIDNHIAPTNLLVSGREYLIGQAPNGQPMYSLVKEFLGSNLRNTMIWDENLGGEFTDGSKIVQIEALTYTQGNLGERVSGSMPHMYFRQNTTEGEWVLGDASTGNFTGPLYLKFLYTKNIDPVTSIVTAPEYAQLQSIYAESGTPTSQILKLDQEILVGQSPSGKKMYAMTKDYADPLQGFTQNSQVKWTDGVGDQAGQTTVSIQIVSHVALSGAMYTGEAGSSQYWKRQENGIDWYWVGNGFENLISTRYYTYDNDTPVNLVTPDEFAVLALDTYQSPALSFNTSLSLDIQVGTWTTGQPLYKRSYEFPTTLVNGTTLWTDTGTEQSVKGDIVLFEGAGATIRSYDDSAVFVELTPQVGIDQRVATIVGGGITNSIIDRYFIKTDETAADIEQTVGIPDAPSDTNQYARKDGAWDLITGGSSGGGASELDDLSDVNTSSVTLGDVLVYGETGSVFAPRALAAADISDFSTEVALAAPVLSVTGVGDISVSNVGSNVFQVSYTGSGGGSNPLTDLEDLNDVPSYVTGNGDKILQADASGTLTWEDVPTGGSSSGIALSDLSVSQVTAGLNALSYDNTTGIFQFTPTDLSGLAPLVHTHTASDITDFDSSVDARIDVKDLAQGTNVTITESNGTYTINAASSGGGGGAVDSVNGATGVVLVEEVPDYSTAQAGQILAISGSTPAWITPVVPVRTLDSLSDVLYFDIDTNAIGTPAAGDVLTMTSFGNWGFAAPATGSGGGASAIDDLSDVDTATAGPATGDVLEWDGTNWTPATPSSGGGGSTPVYLQVDATQTTALDAQAGDNAEGFPGAWETPTISSGTWTLTTGGWTAPSTGDYDCFFMAQAQIDSSSTRSSIGGYFTVNGTQVGLRTSDYSRDDQGRMTTSNRRMIALTSGDTVGFVYGKTSSSSVNIQAGTGAAYFSITKLS